MAHQGWHLTHTRKAEKALRKLDKLILQRIRTYLDEVAPLDNPRDRGKPLTANKTGLWRYRIICDIQEDQLVILALEAGHRNNIYND